MSMLSLNCGMCSSFPSATTLLLARGQSRALNAGSKLSRGAVPFAAHLAQRECLVVVSHVLRGPSPLDSPRTAAEAHRLALPPGCASPPEPHTAAGDDHGAGDAARPPARDGRARRPLPAGPELFQAGSPDRPRCGPGAAWRAHGRTSPARGPRLRHANPDSAHA